jgi:hypothetical protein
MKLREFDRRAQENIKMLWGIGRGVNMQKLEDVPKETLVNIIKTVYKQLGQKVLAYPDTIAILNNDVDLSIYQPSNALVNVVHETGKFDPSKDEANFLPLSTMAIKYLKDAGYKIIHPEKGEL